MLSTIRGATLGKSRASSGSGFSAFRDIKEALHGVRQSFNSACDSARSVKDSFNGVNNNLREVKEAYHGGTETLSDVKETLRASTNMYYAFNLGHPDSNQSSQQTQSEPRQEEQSAPPQEAVGEEELPNNADHPSVQFSPDDTQSINHYGTVTITCSPREYDGVPTYINGLKLSKYEDVVNVRLNTNEVQNPIPPPSEPLANQPNVEDPILSREQA